MPTLSEILTAAHDRGSEKALSYEGAVSPAEAYELLQKAPGSRIVDVRTRAELDFVGRIPDSVEIEWQGYPGGRPNPDFLAQLQRQVDKEALVMFICRSGARSHSASFAETDRSRAGR